MAVYLVALSLLPCSDADDHCRDTPAGVEQADGPHDHAGDTGDGCSPLCSCGCCSISIIWFEYSSPGICPLLQQYTSKKVAMPADFIVSNYYGNIWQPPKVVLNTPCA